MKTYLELGIIEDFDGLKLERLDRIVPIILNDEHRLAKYNISGDKEEIEDELYQVLSSLSISELLEVEYNIFGNNLEVEVETEVE